MQEKIILKRKIYNKILEWKEKYAPDYALFLKGARRVGKTTIAEEFGKSQYKTFITINFQRANDTIKDLFVNGLMDLDYFFNVLQMQYKTILHPRESLIILDEIQLFPKARQALKTLLEDKRFDYIETGSLAGITKKSKKAEILIPSEEYCVEMFPLDFEEFLWANGDLFTMDIVREHYHKLKPFGVKLHKEILRRFREYMCVGGMPQADMQNVNVQPAQFQNFATDMAGVAGQENIGLIKDVPLEVTVELGRTSKSISEILNFAPGTIIELDRIAGEPIDVLVNGKFVARGEVVVIEESFGVRVTEIIK